MNFIYKQVWSCTQQMLIVVGEHAKSAGKKNLCNRGARTIAKFTILASLFSIPWVLSAPQGGVVTYGSATITQQGGDTTIHQSSVKTIIDWQSFDIAKTETTRFNQPSAQSVALNRIHDSNGSQIMGALKANGHVFLINPNGVTFAKGANVNVGGLVASTLDISNEKFIKGNYQFKANGDHRGRIINMGNINANTVALLGNQVVNKGWIVAAADTGNGSVALVAADEVTLSFGAGQRLGVKVDKGTINALIDNQQLIQADGGRILLRAEAAGSVFGAAVRSSGTLRARTLANVRGEIVLLSDMQHGKTTVSGTLDASAPEQGDGGFIETSGATVDIAKGTQITTIALQGKTGQWLIDPADYRVASDGLGNITGADLSTALETTHVTIATSPLVGAEAPADDSGGDLGDITVDDGITWDASTTLTLLADNNIYINQEIKATGDGAGVNFDTKLDNNAQATVFAASDHLQLGENGKVTLLGVDATYQLDGKSFTVINGKNSSLDGNSVVEELTAIASDSRRYMLGTDVDLAGVDWNPLGKLARGFTGAGHTIDNLTINAPTQSNVALFKETSVNSFIRDISLTNVNVTGGDYTASLVGLSQGYIYNSKASGSVTGNNIVGGLVAKSENITGMFEGKRGVIEKSTMVGSVAGAGNRIGGLVGDSNAAIRESRAEGEVTGNIFVGGLVGASRGEITSSYAEVKVTGTQGRIGGLAGASYSTIDKSYATGDVKGTVKVGGLVGHSEGKIKENYAEGTVTGSGNQIGGLVGFSSAAITESSAQGAVTGDIFVGGLVGRSESSITSSHAIGEVAGRSRVGGLVGASFSYVDSSYATGGVQGSYRVGGLAGMSEGEIKGSYAQGVVTGSGNQIGGLVGLSSAAITESSAQGAVTGNIFVGGLVGRSEGEITSSYAEGNVTGEKTRVGGLVGASFAAISKSYATGDVSGESRVGGLVGSLQSDLSNTYASGTVKGNSDIGGLVGHTVNANIEQSYASGSTSSTQENAAGGLVGDASGLMNASNNYFSEATGQENAFGYGIRADGATKLTLEQANSASSYPGLDIGATEGEGKSWYIYEGQTTPLLTGVTPNPNLSTGSESTPTPTGPPDLSNFTNPITSSITPLNVAVSANSAVVFDPAPFGPTAAGGESEEVATQTYFDDKLSVENGGAKRSEGLSQQAFECLAEQIENCQE